MFCILCRKPILNESDKDDYRPAHKTCWEDRLRTPGVKDHFCIDCTVPIEKVIGKNGCVKNSNSIRCSHCRIIHNMKSDMDHIERMRVEKRSPIKRKNRAKARDEAVRKWRKNNGHKYDAQILATIYKDRLTILYECSCNIPSDQKDRHHPDYSKPLEVMLLCHRCHMKWHSKVKQEAIQTASAVDG